MYLFWILIFIFESFNLTKSDQIEYFESIQYFQTYEILEGLSQLNTSAECGRDLSKYLIGLNNTEMWAMTMFDSSAKVPDGIFKGNSIFMGQYDECIEVEHPDKIFTGQHCMFDINVHMPMNRKSVKMVRPLQTAVTEDLTISLFYGICLPSTCTPLEINSGIQLLFNLTGIPKNILNVSLDEANCRTNEPIPIKDSDWAVIGVLIAFGVIALISTVYEVFAIVYQKNGKPHPLLSSFSIYANGKQLFRISEASSQLKCLHGLRFFSMCWVVFGHAYAMSTFAGAVNLTDLGKMMKDINHTFIINAYVAVDSFFFLSGLLVCFVFFRDISKKKYYDVPLGYIHRYLRLTPPFAVMMLIQATIFNYLGNGPLWHNIGESAAAGCRENWWSGLLYVQNFATPNSNCLGQSWYLSTDMQLYWLSPLLLYPMLFWPLFAPVYLLLIILVVAFADFAIAYIYELGPSAGLTTNADQWTLDYIQFYTRAVPWLIGAALAYVICGIQAKKIKIELTPLWVTVGWMVSTGLCLGSLYGIVPFTDYDYTTLEAASYLAFHRVMWALGLAWIVFACVQGYGGVINSFLSWGIFQPLGKLSYCTFLIHMSVQLYRIGSQRTNFYFGDLEVTYYFLGDIVLANLLSIPLTLLFEIPFGNLDRFFFQNVKILPLPRPKKVLQTKGSNSEEVNNNDNNLKEVVSEGEKNQVESEKS